MRALLFLFVGCAACSPVSIYARATAGRVGCPAEQIDIRSHNDGQPGPRSWVAACGGEEYVCSSEGALEDVHSEIVCSPLAPGVRKI
jgi:hypothetical protein